MKQHEFKKLHALADALEGQCERWFASEELAGLRRSPARLSASLPDEYSLTISVDLEVFDEHRERGVRLLNTGITAVDGKEPFRVHGDSSPHRYIVDGEICHVPHDYCPHCWGIWDFKLTHPTCPDCGYALGKEVRLLLDRDVCPHCERGEVSSRALTCHTCGFTVDPTFVAWG